MLNRKCPCREAGHDGSGGPPCPHGFCSFRKTYMYKMRGTSKKKSSGVQMQLSDSIVGGDRSDENSQAVGRAYGVGQGHVFSAQETGKQAPHVSHVIVNKAWARSLRETKSLPGGGRVNS